jgi:hypothetical protein
VSGAHTERGGCWPRPSQHAHAHTQMTPHTHSHTLMHILTRLETCSTAPDCSPLTG